MIDPNDPRSGSMFSSAKMRYLEDGENRDEENDDVGELGLQIQSSSNQLKFKYLGEIFFLNRICVKIGMELRFRFIQGHAIIHSIPS